MNTQTFKPVIDISDGILNAAWKLIGVELTKKESFFKNANKLNNFPYVKRMSDPGPENLTRQDAAALFTRTIASHGSEYVRLMVPDMHGLLRGKVYPARSVNAEGEPLIVAALTFMHNGMPADLPEQSSAGFGNCVMVPCPGRIYRLPTSNRRTHGAAVSLGLCEFKLQNGDPVKEDVRWLARQQLGRLADRGLEIWSGTEFEIRMYKVPPEGGEAAISGRVEKLHTAHENPHIFTAPNLELYENFVVDLERRLQMMNIGMYTMHAECGRGQVEIPLLPAWGIDYADNSCLFKMTVKDCALDHNMLTSFMTKDDFTEFANGAHFNHSLWTIPTEKAPRRNALRDPDAPQQLSRLGQNWLAGIMAHGPALCALCCPTVNCYRRIGQPWAPGIIDWGHDNRLSAFRVKLGCGEGDTFLESRLPSGPANPYLVLAGTVAAGLDGLERGLELPKEMDGKFGKFPATLERALCALESDSYMCSVMGDRFVRWYTAMKRVEISDMKMVDVFKNRLEDLRQERHFYQFFV